MKTGRALRAVWLQAGICIVFIAAVDAIVRLARYVTTPKSVDSRVMSDSYKNTTWAAQYFADLDSTWVQWNPYSYWISLPYRSRFMNIDPDGLRVMFKGKHAAHDAGYGPTRIFTFGGSTMWGEGARDAYTIPSWLQRLLDGTSYDTTVINYGQDGYVSSQEMIFLFEQLQKGNVPDLVIFYDGFNDSTSAMINGAAGVTFGEANRRVEFNAFTQSSKDNSVR
jgi:hypothetical protein